MRVIAMRSVLLAAALGLIALPANAAEMTALDRMEAAQGCEAALYQFARNLDEDNVEGVVGIFVENGVLTSGSGTSQGHDAIRAAVLRGRAPGEKKANATRHVITNVVTTIKDKDHCSLTAYQMMYSFAADSAAVPSLSARLAGVLNDEFVRTREGWRYAKRHLTAVSAGTR